MVHRLLYVVGAGGSRRKATLDCRRLLGTFPETRSQNYDTHYFLGKAYHHLGRAAQATRNLKFANPREMTN
jgi:hypothetical protein